MAASGTLKLRAWGFLLAALGGFLIALGALLPWASNRIGEAAIAHGVDETIGLVVLVLGVLIVLGIFAMRFQPTLKRRRIVGVLVLLFALVAMGCTVYAWINIEDVFFDISAVVERLAADTGLSLTEARAELSSSIDIGVGAGIYLPLVGGVLAVIGAILSLMWAKRRADQEASDEDIPADPSVDEPAGSD